MRNPHAVPDERYNHSEASRKLGVDRKTLRAYVKKGYIEQGMTVDGKPYYVGEWLNKFYKSYYC